MSTTQKTVHAATEADLVYLLTQHGFLAAGQPIAGVTGWAYLGPWSLAGTPMPDVAAHVWWINEPADEAEAEAREATITALRTAGALHEGNDAACSLLGTVGQPQRPSDHAMIGVLRDLHRKACGVQAAGKWWHSDDQSRDLYAQAAALIALGANPAPVPWKTMDGSITMMTSQTLLAVLGALAVSDTTHHALAEQARAQLAAGSPADVHAITWPAGYGES
jgi:hypothetical protein